MNRPIILPASSSGLEKIYARQSQLLCVYDNGRARLWDIEQQTLRKSLSHAEAVEIIAHMDGWDDM